MMNKTVAAVSTASAAAPGGHYSQAIVHGDHIYISGQLPIRPRGKAGEDVGDFESQARLALQNLLNVLAAAGGDPETLLKVTVYVVDIQNWPIFNRVYAELLGTARPARSVVPVPNLHYGYLLEVDAIAVRRASLDLHQGS
jgi:reactive intermediate/imine deaminase